MPNYSKKVVYLTNEQYQTLTTNGTITVNGTTVTYNENDLYVTPQVYPVSDVQMNGTSVVSSGVANIPYASNGAYGLVRPTSTYGVSIVGNSYIGLVAATDAQIKAGSAAYVTVLPNSMYKSVFYGLAKAAGDSSQAESINSVGAYTGTAKQAIQTMLGTNSMLAPIEADYVADRSYAIGEVFCMDGKLYKVTAAISQNGTITPGTNCSETSVISKVGEVADTKADKTDTVLETTLSRGRKAGTAVGNYSFAFGVDATASGNASIAFGAGTNATSNVSFAEGWNTTASGLKSHAEGNYSIASGTSSHAEGDHTTASGTSSHAEGYNSTASGHYSHVEGEYTSARASISHTEGYNTITKGIGSHTEGHSTIASASFSHVYGKCNIEDSYSSWSEWIANTEYSVGDKVKVTVTNGNDTTVTGYICKTANSDSEFTVANWDIDTYMNYVEIVGNGHSDARSNAYALDWDGNGHFAGNVYVGANADSTGGTRVPHDVQINGTSIVNNGVANIPIGQNTLGVVKQAGMGVAVDSQGRLVLSRATDAQIKDGTHYYSAIEPANQHIAFFYGMAKAAGDTTQSASSNAVGTYTPEAKAAIQSMLGVETGVVFVESVSGTTPTITGVANTRYVCGEVSTIDITPPVSGTIDVTFTSGSTPALLTLPNTVKFPAWVDLTTLDADTTYEIMITDGVYGGVMTWPV